jgi:hypothetical protein
VRTTIFLSALPEWYNRCCFDVQPKPKKKNTSTYLTAKCLVAADSNKEKNYFFKEEEEAVQFNEPKRTTGQRPRLFFLFLLSSRPLTAPLTGQKHFFIFFQFHFYFFFFVRKDLFLLPLHFWYR